MFLVFFKKHIQKIEIRYKNERFIVLKKQNSYLLEK